MPRSGRSRDNVDEEELDSTFARTKAEGEALGLKGVELVNYIKEQRQAEAEAEQRRQQAEAEAEQRRLQAEAEAEQRRLHAEAEAEERRLQTEERRTVRGPMQILKELWTKEEENEEKRTTFQYIVDLRNRIEDTCRLARENLRTAAGKQALHFNKRAKPRCFKVGDQVLILLPTKNNKLQMCWKGPYVITDRINECDYKISIGEKEKIYHANILKEYVSRTQDTGETHIVEESWSTTKNIRQTCLGKRQLYR
ncbi:hypothetical protein C0Q70_12529 [Pomacea canaliculata]|uniref:Uncharacterized protein n=1 Tax=Pomacea canaliculata TaxID=400727 RepID=A0A2T7P1S0_POMCA|nr:hypothetical protein C0Q70_12529 [Pomacea canaliculata]